MKFKIEDLVIPVEIRPQGTMVRLTHIIETSLSYGIRLDNEKMVAFNLKEAKGPFTKEEYPELFI